MIGAGMGLLLGKENDRRQIEQERKLMDMQISGQRELMQYGQDLQYDMWKKTNYDAQKAELKKAGLNPGLMYGMGGGGGVTTGSASGSVSGGHAPAGGGEALAMAGMGLQMGMQKAQIENIEADTELKKADAGKKSGVETEEGYARIGSIIQETKNKQAQEALTKVQTGIAELDKKLKTATLDDMEDLARWAAETAKFNMSIAEREDYVGKATRDQRVDQVGATLAETIARAGLAKSNIQVNDAQIKKMAEDIAQGWAGLDRQERELKLKTIEAEFRAAYPGIGAAAGRIVNGITEGILGILPGETPRYKFDTEKK